MRVDINAIQKVYRRYAQGYDVYSVAPIRRVWYPRCAAYAGRAASFLS